MPRIRPWPWLPRPKPLETPAASPRREAHSQPSLFGPEACGAFWSPGRGMHLFWRRLETWACPQAALVQPASVLRTRPRDRRAAPGREVSNLSQDTLAPQSLFAETISTGKQLERCG